MLTKKLQNKHPLRVLFQGHILKYIVLFSYFQIVNMIANETTNMRKSLSNANVKVSQEQELLDVVLKNKKLIKN